MRKYIILLLFTVLINDVNAQVSIQPLLPMVGIVQKNTLWNIAIVNSSKTNYDCRIELTLRDRVSGLEVFTATTSQFILATGAKQLNESILAPLQYNYLSTMASRRDDFIPIGNYIVCYRLTEIGKLPLAEECVAFDVEPLSPPMLITPSDSAILEVAPSQFTWIPPAPMNLFNRLDYQIVIVEILDGQKPEEAIQQNLPFYTEPNISINQLSYKGTVTNFEKDKTYAWQVVAKDNSSYAGKSEVWTFKIASTIEKIKNTPISYILMEEDIKGVSQINSNEIYLKYASQINSFEAEIIFSDEKGNRIKKVNQTIQPGDNYLNFSLNNQFKKDKIYVVSIKADKIKTRSITFSINSK